VFVALYSALLLHVLLTRREWAGGVLILAGALLLVRWKRGKETATAPRGW